jgi:hypothetical protein
MLSLPTPYRGNVVIPYAPNSDGDRPHSWDSPADSSETPSGLAIVSVRDALGPETITLGYDGLTRAEARTLEQFVEDQAGRHEGFWCPTFQHDFYGVALVSPFTATHPGGQVSVRDWGYKDEVWSLGFGYRQIAAYRAGTVGGAWCLTQWEPHSGPVIEDVLGNVLWGYNLSSGGTAGNTDVIGDSDRQGVATGLMLSRLLWCRFADDAITTEWFHPNHASITLRVTSDSNAAPSS